MAASKIDMKVVLLGQEYVGKTCLAHRCIHNRFGSAANYQATIGAAFGGKKVTVDGKSVLMGVWDTAGSERYAAMSRIYYRSAKAAIVCYDSTDPASFDIAKNWIEELKKAEEECKLYLVCTKKDLIDKDPKARKVDYYDAQDYATAVNACMFETSSKTGENISELFYKIAEDYLQGKHQQPSSDVIQLTEHRTPSNKPRCACWQSSK